MTVQSAAKGHADRVLQYKAGGGHYLITPRDGDNLDGFKVECDGSVVGVEDGDDNTWVLTYQNNKFQLKPRVKCGRTVAGTNAVLTEWRGVDGETLSWSSTRMFYKGSFFRYVPTDFYSRFLGAWLANGFLLYIVYNNTKLTYSVYKTVGVDGWYGEENPNDFPKLVGSFKTTSLFSDEVGISIDWKVSALGTKAAGIFLLSMPISGFDEDFIEGRAIVVIDIDPGSTLGSSGSINTYIETPAEYFIAYGSNFYNYSGWVEDANDDYLKQYHADETQTSSYTGSGSVPVDVDFEYPSNSLVKLIANASSSYSSISSMHTQKTSRSKAYEEMDPDRILIDSFDLTGSRQSTIASTETRSLVQVGGIGAGKVIDLLTEVSSTSSSSTGSVHQTYEFANEPVYYLDPPELIDFQCSGSVSGASLFTQDSIAEYIGNLDLRFGHRAISELSGPENRTSSTNMNIAYGLSDAGPGYPCGNGNFLDDRDLISGSINHSKIGDFICQSKLLNKGSLVATAAIANISQSESSTEPASGIAFCNAMGIFDDPEDEDSGSGSYSEPVRSLYSSNPTFGSSYVLRVPYSFKDYTSPSVHHHDEVSGLFTGWFTDPGASYPPYIRGSMKSDKNGDIILASFQLPALALYEGGILDDPIPWPDTPIEPVLNYVNGIKGTSEIEDTFGVLDDEAAYFTPISIIKFPKDLIDA